MSTVRRYVWKRKSGKWSKPHTLAMLRVVTAKRVVWGKGPYSITQDGDGVAKDLIKTTAVNRFIKLIRLRDVGSTFRVHGRGVVRITARAVHVKLPPPLPVNSTNGNSKADAYYNWVVSNYRSLKPRYAGSYVCKHIAGSWQLSQHSYGNAVDFFFDSLTHQDVVANAVVANATKLRAYHVISRNRVWTKGFGWSTYTGDYHSHLHVDFDPQLSGGCGVRG